MVRRCRFRFFDDLSHLRSLHGLVTVDLLDTTPVPVTVERGAEVKSSANGRFFKLYFIHETSPLTVAPVIYSTLSRLYVSPTSYI